MACLIERLAGRLLTTSMWQRLVLRFFRFTQHCVSDSTPIAQDNRPILHSPLRCGDFHQDFLTRGSVRAFFSPIV
jgi:hypothetical protein